MEDDRRRIIFVILGVLLSVFSLLFLGALKVNYPTFMSLEVHWVALGMLPLVLYLFLGGYIRSFSAFGIGLEATLNEPVRNVLGEMSTSQSLGQLALEAKRSFGKGAIQNLDKLSRQERLGIRFLRFQAGKRNYYRVEAVLEYFRRLPNLEYLEVVNEGRLVTIIPLTQIFLPRLHSDFQSPQSSASHRIKSFIDYLQDAHQPIGFLDEEYTDVATRVQSSTTLVDLLGFLDVQKTRVFSVVSPTGQYLGSILPEEISQVIKRKIAQRQV